MSDYILSCCSPADLKKEHFERRDIHYICFHYELDGVSYPDDLGQTISFPDFYRAMDEGASTKTSQVNMNEYMEYFGGFLEQGKDVLHVCLSGGLSGSVNSANSAANVLRESFGANGKVFRVGGDEFFAVLDGVACRADYIEGVKRMNKAQEAYNLSEDPPVLLAIAHGMAEYDYAEQNPESAERLADSRMYAEKRRMKSQLA